MLEILSLLQTIAPLLSKTTLRQMSHVIYGMLVSSGKITMLGLSRWTEKGGSLRALRGAFWGCRAFVRAPAAHSRAGQSLCDEAIEM